MNDADRLQMKYRIERLAAGRPLVALESTVIAQGLPWPENLATAEAMIGAVHATGATPAMVAVLEGVLRIGLDDRELVTLARSGAVSEDVPENLPAPFQAALPKVAKASRRDLGAFIALGKSAGTTVSATLWITRKFSLAPLVFATGGLGGVHRDASTTFDVSSDLDELARADGALVVCSGFKSILDVPASLEALETRGVLVVGYRTDRLPGFVTRNTRLPLEHHVDTPEDAAAIVRAHRALGLPGAIVLAQPVPDVASLDEELHERSLAEALREAAELKIEGKALTPFLLERIRCESAGASLRANRALLIENARLAGLVAKTLDTT
jgi:pseudouridine-5'-phosphate glycosidase